MTDTCEKHCEATAFKIVIRGLEGEVARLKEALAPCPTCEALARTVMLDQTSHDTTPQQRPWVGLTDDEIKEIVGPYGDTPIKGYTRKLFDQIEAALRSKNT